MTVSSLWKALDRASCGKFVGVKEILDHKNFHGKTNPWNYHEMRRIRSENRPCLAIDLSIWICEGLTSSAMAESHQNPAVYLVYTRCLKLLSEGIKLVGVIEGKRRLVYQDMPGQEFFRKRRGGAPFWRACEMCEKVLGLLGVPVFRAKAEGEALCALLNQKGLVDGVISNDGDCFLFGARVLYTKFSVENLEQSRVVRYDVDRLTAVVDDNDDDGCCEEAPLDKKDACSVAINRDDLIAFALLTGSDLAGNGLPKVGARKALRFIRKCKIDNPLKPETAAIEELKAWARSAYANTMSGNDAESPVAQQCSCCGHAGSKRTHKKEGCQACGTEPGQGCIQLSPGGKFRKSLREKAMAMSPCFDPHGAISAYNNPNKHDIPAPLRSLPESGTVEMSPPNIKQLLQVSFPIKGRSKSSSIEHIQRTASALLVNENLYPLATIEEHGIQPICVEKEILKSGLRCLEIRWRAGTESRREENYLADCYEFVTTETEERIRERYPQLLAPGAKAKKMQGREVDRRVDFLKKILPSDSDDDNERSPPQKKPARYPKKRSTYFEQKEHRPTYPKREAPSTSPGDDARALLSDLHFKANEPRLPGNTRDPPNKSYLAKQDPSMTHVQATIKKHHHQHVQGDCDASTISTKENDQDSTASLLAIKASKMSSSHAGKESNIPSEISFVSRNPTCPALRDQQHAAAIGPVKDKTEQDPNLQHVAHLSRLQMMSESESPPNPVQPKCLVGEFNDFAKDQCREATTVFGLRGNMQKSVTFEDDREMWLYSPEPDKKAPKDVLPSGQANNGLESYQGSCAPRRVSLLGHTDPARDSSIPCNNAEIQLWTNPNSRIESRYNSISKGGFGQQKAGDAKAAANVDSLAQFEYTDEEAVADSNFRIEKQFDEQYFQPETESHHYNDRLVPGNRVLSHGRVDWECLDLGLSEFPSRLECNAWLGGNSQYGLLPCCFDWQVDNNELSFLDDPDQIHHVTSEFDALDGPLAGVRRSRGCRRG